MKTRHILALVLVVALMACMMVGCSKSSSSSAASSSKLDQILKAGTIKIGVNPGGVPICYYDDSGKLCGYDVDWANKLGEVLGVKVEFVTVDGETRISAIQSGQVDVIFANITGNLERAQVISFSIPYLKTGIKMLTAKGSNYHVIDDLNTPDATIAVDRGTTSEAMVLEHCPKANLTYVAGSEDAVLLVLQGKADATFEDGTLIDYSAGQYNDKLESQPTVYTSDPICIGTARGDADWLRYLDMFVSWQISNGFQADRYSYWWGTDFTGTLEHPW